MADKISYIFWEMWMKSFLTGTIFKRIVLFEMIIDYFKIQSNFNLYGKINVIVYNNIS